MIDDVILALLANGVVAWLAQLDDKFAQAHREELEQLRKRCDAIRTGQGRVDQLGIETLREIGVGNEPAARLALVIASDPLALRDLTQWLMEPDPDAYDSRRAATLVQLANRCECRPEDLDATVRSMEDRVNRDLGISNWRQHQEHRLILQRLNEEVNLVAELRRDVAILLERSLNGLSEGALVRVDPTPKPLTTKNGLLTGERPRIDDIAQGLDFRRNVYPRVMELIRNASEPALFLFRGEAQIGKTTFMLRIGFDLAAIGYPVFVLSSARNSERYADWIQNAAPELGDLPLVLLVDNAGSVPRNFCSQMNSIHERNTRAVVLATERNEVLKRGDDDKAFESLAIHANEVDLGNAEGEATNLVKHLAATKIVEIDEAALTKVLEQAKALEGGPGYFARVMEIASKHRPVPEVVAEALDKAGDDATAAAFRRLYRLVCVTGAVGLSVPEEIVAAVLDLKTISMAMQFAESLATQPIRIEEGRLAVTHERHADAFIEFETGATNWELIDSLREIVGAAVARQGQTMFLGSLFVALRVRGLGEAAITLWDQAGDRIDSSHWNMCSAASLTQVWGAFFLHCKRFDEALVVNRLAHDREPGNVVVHNNWAIALQEMKQYDAAREHYETALEINPRYVESHNNYAILLKKMKQYDAAREHYEKALEINPRNANTHYNYAILLREMNQYDAARAHHEKGLEVNPRDAGAHFNYANLLKEMRQYDAACEHYEKALEINPLHAKTAANFAYVMLVLGNVTEALDHAACAIRLGILGEEIGGRVVGWFEERSRVLRDILQSNESSELRRGTAAFLLLALNDDRGKELVESLWDDSAFSAAQGVAEELAEAFRPAKSDADSQDPA